MNTRVLYDTRNDDGENKAKEYQSLASKTLFQGGKITDPGTSPRTLYDQGKLIIAWNTGAPAS